MYLLVVMIELLDTWLEKNEPPAYGSPYTKEGAMSLALRIAHKGVGLVAPNPIVGAVILNQDNRFICAGYHKKYGDLHAEAMAISKLESLQKRGETYKIFVTLEPCSHQGKQPACANTILESPIEEVFFASKDPNSEVSGNGEQMLMNAGIACTHLIEFNSQEKIQNRIFYHHCAEHKKSGPNRPFVAIKVATDQDGFMAAEGDKRRNLTSARSRKYTHFIRAQYDAVVIGAQTLLLDDPQLNTRDFCVDDSPEPYKVIIAGLASLKALSAQAKIFDQQKLLVVTDENDFSSLGSFSSSQVVTLSRNAASRFDVSQLLDKLSSLGLTSLMIEGGAKTFQPFLDAGLVDYMHMFIAPKKIGGEKRIYWYEGISSLKFENSSSFSIGEDRLVESFVEYL